MKKFAVILVLGTVLAGCSDQVQTTSGAQYLARYQNVPVASGSTGDAVNIDQEIRKAAAVEPILRFPARIGLAKIDTPRCCGGTTLAPISAEEAEAWKKTQDKLGSGFGEFVPLSPLVVSLVVDSINADRKTSLLSDVMSRIRVGAARQHLDAVLIYETFSKENRSENILALADVTVLGGFLLPSRDHEVQAFADAMLIDVVQGYPYGTLQTVVDKQTEATSAWGWGPDRSDDAFAQKLKLQAAKQLADEASTMFGKLRLELAEKRANPAS